MEANEVIPIEEDDIVDNLDHILENSNIFQTNSNIDTLKCFIFYYEGNKMLNFKNYEIQINENRLTKKELLAIVLKHNKVQHKSFDLTGIYKYELEIQDKQIKEFCKNNKDFSFLSQYHTIQDIVFHPCVEIFNDNNSLLLFFSHKSPKKGEETEKVKPKNKTQKRVKFTLDEKPKKTKTMKVMSETNI